MIKRSIFNEKFNTGCTQTHLSCSKSLLVRVVSLLLILALSLSLFGCHGSAEMNVFEVPDGLDPNKEYNITFWAKNDSNINQVKIYNKAVEDFESLYPNINVTLKRYTNYNDIYKDVITNIATGTTPNVCISYPDHIATYMTSDNAVVPLSSLMYDGQYGLGGSEVLFDSPSPSEIVPKFLSECNVAGDVYLLPFMRSTEACYINKDYVEALGYEVPDVLSWDFIFEVSEAALAKDAEGNFAVNGQDVLVPFIYKSTDNMMIQMLRQLGAGYSTSGGDIEIFNDETRGILYTVAEHNTTGAFSTFAKMSYPGNLFNAGRCIFAVDSTAGATWMGPNAPLIEIPEEEIVDFEVAVRPVPQFDTDTPKMISQGPSVCIFNKEDPGEVLASWLFLQYLLTDEVQIGFSKTEGYVPVTTRAQESEEYLDYLTRSGEDDETYYSVKIAAAKLLIDYVDSSFVTPVFNGSALLRSASGQMIEEVIKGIERGHEINDAFIDKLYGDMRTRYKLDTISVSGRIELGEMPSVSVGLLVGIGGVWALICAYVITDKIRAIRRKRREEERAAGKSS